MSYWPWWLGATALSSAAVLFWLLAGRPLGVSGSIARVLRKGDDGPALDDDAAMDALLAATREQFGSEAVTGADSVPSPAPRAPARLSWGTHAAFLAAMVAGGAIAALTHGGWHARGDLGADYARFVGSGWRAWIALGAGGVLVGFGTAMAGGCTSGHGLCGTSRLQPGSLVATAAFFGAGVAVSFVLARLA